MRRVFSFFSFVSFGLFFSFLFFFLLPFQAFAATCIGSVGTCLTDYVLTTSSADFSNFWLATDGNGAQFDLNIFDPSGNLVLRNPSGSSLQSANNPYHFLTDLTHNVALNTSTYGTYTAYTNAVIGGDDTQCATLTACENHSGADRYTLATFVYLSSTAAVAASTSTLLMSTSTDAIVGYTFQFLFMYLALILFLGVAYVIYRITRK